MEARQLRIGNYYSYKGNEITLSIEDFREAEHNLLGLLEPIPLTEERILKFGFIKKENEFFLFFKNEEGAGIWINSKMEVFVAGFDCPNFDYALRTKVKHVHELQNLHFALTGEEFKINEI